jgi:hypothetical protein
MIMGGLAVLFLIPPALALMFWYMGLSCYYHQELSLCFRSLPFDRLVEWFRWTGIVSGLTVPFAAIVILVWIFGEIERRPN